MKESAYALSGGQQQRLCIAVRWLSLPSVLLMDEPASALDPISTAKVEELIHELKKDYTIVIVTHNMQQAARVSDKTAFFLYGRNGGVRSDEKDIHESGERGYAELYYRTFRIVCTGMAGINRNINHLYIIDYGKVYRIGTHPIEERKLMKCGPWCITSLTVPGEAVLTLDKELAQQVMVRERRVNAFELRTVMWKILSHYDNPVAIDLRFVLAMLKINTNLERLGDFAEGIARFVIRCKEPVLDAELMTTRLRRLAEMQAEVFNVELAKRALHEENIEMATVVFGKDNLLDDINAEATGILGRLYPRTSWKQRIHVLTWLVFSANWNVRATILLI